MASGLRPYGGYWEPTPKMDRPSCPKVFGEAITSCFAVLLATSLTIEPCEVYPMSSPPADAHSRGVDQSLLVQWLTGDRHVLSGSSNVPR